MTTLILTNNKDSQHSGWISISSSKVESIYFALESIWHF